MKIKNKLKVNKKSMKILNKTMIILIRIRNYKISSSETKIILQMILKSKIIQILNDKVIKIV